MLLNGKPMTTVSIRLQKAPLDIVQGETDQTLYETLADNGLELRKACDNGSCGVCRCRLMSGAVDYRGRHPHGLNGGQQADGWILPCIAFPKADLKLNNLRIENT